MIRFISKMFFTVVLLGAALLAYHYFTQGGDFNAEFFINKAHNVGRMIISKAEDFQHRIQQPDNGGNLQDPHKSKLAEAEKSSAGIGLTSEEKISDEPVHDSGKGLSLRKEKENGGYSNEQFKQTLDRLSRLTDQLSEEK